MPKRPKAHRPSHWRPPADRRELSSRQRGYTTAWEKAREAYLRRYPLCAICLTADILTAATVVDHIIDHKGNHDLFWDESNWQPLCKLCHDRKTAAGIGRSAEGAFLRPK